MLVCGTRYNAVARGGRLTRQTVTGDVNKSRSVTRTVTHVAGWHGPGDARTCQGGCPA